MFPYHEKLSKRSCNYMHIRYKLCTKCTKFTVDVDRIVNRKRERSKRKRRRCHSEAIRLGQLFPPADTLPSSISKRQFSHFFLSQSLRAKIRTTVARSKQEAAVGSRFQRSGKMLMHWPPRIIIKCGRSEIWWWWLSAADSTVSGEPAGKNRLPWKFSERERCWTIL